MTWPYLTMNTIFFHNGTRVQTYIIGVDKFVVWHRPVGSTQKRASTHTAIESVS
jgi:sRNA-binding regulator protein Hfq